MGLYLFVFVLGGLSSLAVVFLLLVNFLNTAEQAIQKEYDDAKKATADADTQGVAVGDKKTQVQVEAVGSPDVPEWMYGFVRANMVFLFKSDLDTQASGIFRLDGCKVSVIKNNTEQSSPWNKKNPVQITSADKNNLYHQSKTVLIYCKTAKELEAWYYALLQGANLSVKKDAISEQKAKKEQSYFSFLYTILKNANPPTSSRPSSSSSLIPSPATSPNPSPSPSPIPSPALNHNIPPPLPPKPSDSNLNSHLTWLNALLSRIFWNVHDAPDFSAFLSRKFNKKLLKIKKPAILKSVAICNITFGPNLPMINSAHLDFISPTGEVVIVGDVLYHGGFTLTIAIELFVEVLGHSLSVPVTVTAHVTRLHGRAVVRVPPPPSQRLWFAFEREPTCDIDVDTSFGAAGKVANVPRLAKIIVNALKTELLKFVVLPNMEDFLLPKFKGQRGDKHVAESTVNTDTPNTTPSAVPIPTPTPSATSSNPRAGSPTLSIDKSITDALEKLDKTVQPDHL